MESVGVNENGIVKDAWKLNELNVQIKKDNKSSNHTPIIS